MKKIWMTLFLVALLLITVSAQADTRTSGLYTYEIKGNGTITITGFDWAQNNADIYIPNMIDGYTVTGIADEAFRCETQQKTSYSVTLPNSITIIGTNAFWNANISAINIPDSVQLIGYGAFVGCPECQYKVSPSHSVYAEIDGALYCKTNKELIAYYDESSKFEIPEGIVSIGDYAMYREKYPSYSCIVKMPSTLQKIGAYAFYRCKLSGYTQNYTLLPENIKEIGEFAFAYTKFMTSNIDRPLFDIIIPDSVEQIGKGAFSNITTDSAQRQHYNLIINQNSRLTSIAEETFRDSMLRITIDAGIESIGAYAFSGGYETVLVQMDISNVVEFGEYAFAKNTSSGGNSLLTDEVILSSAIKTIPAGFNISLHLPDTVTGLCSNAYTVTVTDFYLPASLTTIAVDAFPKGSTFVVEAGSYAALWASENGFGYSIEGQNNLDWLN